MVAVLHHRRATPTREVGVPTRGRSENILGVRSYKENSCGGKTSSWEASIVITRDIGVRDARLGVGSEHQTCVSISFIIMSSELLHTHSMIKQLGW